MTCSLLMGYRLVVILSSLIVNTNNIIYTYQTITYNQKTTHSEQVAYLRNLSCTDYS